MIPPLIQVMVNEASEEIDEIIAEQEKCWNYMNGGTLVLSRELMAHAMFWQREEERFNIEVEIASCVNAYAEKFPSDFNDKIPF